MAEIAQRTKLVLKDLGEPAMVKTLTDGQNRYVLGTLYVMASSVISRKNPKAGGDNEPDTYEGLAGTFRMVPSDAKRDTLESGILFVPDAFHNMIADTVKAATKDDPNAIVRTAFEIASIKAANPAGYSWEFKPLMQQAVNPMDNFVGEIAEHRQKMLAAPKEEKAPAGKKK